MTLNHIEFDNHGAKSHADAEFSIQWYVQMLTTEGKFLPEISKQQGNLPVYLLPLCVNSDWRECSEDDLCCESFIFYIQS